MKKKLLIYSHCFIYGGSERLMKSIYDNVYIEKEYDVFFSYHNFKEYKLGLYTDNEGRLDKKKFLPLKTLDHVNLFYRIDLAVKSILLRYLIKLPFFLLKKIKVYSIWNSILFYFLLLRIKPDVVHINNGGYPAASGCNQLSRILRFYPKINVVYQVNNIAYQTKSKWKKYKDSLIYSRVNAFLTHSYQAADALVRRGFPRENIKTMPSFFEEKIDPTINIRKEFNIKDGTMMIVSVGMLTYRKGHLFLLKAMNKIKYDYPDCYNNLKLIIVGSGEEKDNLQDYLEQNGIENVVLAGYRTDTQNFIYEADLFILPSVENEDLPLVLLTAMQYNKCILASDFAGIGDLLTNKIDSLLVQPKVETIADSLAENIACLYKDSEFRNYLGENVKNTYNAKLSKSEYSRNLLKLYSGS